MPNKEIWTKEKLLSHGKYLVEKYGYLPDGKSCRGFGEKPPATSGVRKHFGSFAAYKAALGTLKSLHEIKREKQNKKDLITYRQLCDKHKPGGFLKSSEAKAIDTNLQFRLRRFYGTWSEFLLKEHGVSSKPRNKNTININGKTFKTVKEVALHYGKSRTFVRKLLKESLNSDDLHNKLSKELKYKKPYKYWDIWENVEKEIQSKIISCQVPDGEMPKCIEIDKACVNSMFRNFGGYIGVAKRLNRVPAKSKFDQYFGSHSKNKCTHFENNIIEIVRSLEGHVRDLPQKSWLMILRQSKALEMSHKSVLQPIKMRLLQGELRPEDIIPPEADPDAPSDAPAPVSKLREMLDELRAGTLEEPEVVVDDSEVAESINEDSEQQRQHLLNLSPQRILDSVSAAARATSDEKALNSIAHEATERHWTKCLRSADPASIAEDVRASVPQDKWAALVRDRFLADWTLIEQLGDIPGFVPSGDIERLNLMQLREAALLRRDRRRLNTSGMGAGKTLAALSAVSVAGCQRVLVLCPNNSISGWLNPLQTNFPGAAVTTKTWEPKFSPGSPQFLINNHEMMSDHGLERLAEFVVAFNPDALIVDELHLAKVRTKATESQRHRNLKALLADLRERGAVIYGMTGTPVVNELQEAISLLGMVEPSAAEGLDPNHKVDNCLAVHAALQPLTSRYVPPLPCRKQVSNITVRADHLLDETVAACMRSAVTADAVLTTAKRDALVRLAAEPGKLLVFTSAVTGVVDEMRDALERAGIKTVIHTGEEKAEGDVASVMAFQEDPSVKVLIASSSTLATGFDGLQKVCGRVCFLTLPWTAAEHDQAVARILRQGSEFNSVEITYLIAVLQNPECGEDWSLDRQKLDRLTGKRTIADAVCDGVIPDRAALQLTEAKVRKGLKKWAERVSKTQQQKEVAA